MPLTSILWDLDDDPYGNVRHGRQLLVFYEEIDPETVYPVTAYDVPRRHRP